MRFTEIRVCYDPFAVSCLLPRRVVHFLFCPSVCKPVISPFSFPLTPPPSLLSDVSSYCPPPRSAFLPVVHVCGFSSPSEGPPRWSGNTLFWIEGPLSCALLPFPDLNPRFFLQATCRRSSACIDAFPDFFFSEKWVDFSPLLSSPRHRFAGVLLL